MKQEEICPHKPRIEEREKYKWFALWCEGKSCEMIAKRFGRRSETISHFIREFLGMDELPQTRTRSVSIEHD
mgnify:CR=1 FL=1